MKRFGRVLIQAAIIALLTVILVGVTPWLSPRIVGLYRETRLAILEAARGQTVRPGHTGLIYVESPEVYTRQRLVNDRYLQDAWLRDRLREVDSPNAGWLDEAHVEMRRAVIGVLAGEGSSTGPESDDAATPVLRLSDEALQQLSTIPFETRFRLQSEARDKIRQMILENALDDRHDLSGNTVFGLKFDTSILPGSETLLQPTVIVRMDDNPLDILLSQPQRRLGSPQKTATTAVGNDAVSATRRKPEEFVRHFMRYVGDTADAMVFPENELGILMQIDEYFGDWLNNIERRIDEFRGQRETACELDRLKTDLCAGSKISDGARSVLTKLFNQEDEEVADALAYVTRLHKSETRIAARLRDQVLSNAEVRCEDADAKGELPTLGDFLHTEQTRLGPFTAIPGTWGQFFDAQTQFRLSRQPAKCRLDVDISLVPKEVDVYVITKPDSGDVDLGLRLMEGLVPLTCEEDQCRDFEVWVQPRPDMSPGAIKRLKSALSPPTLHEIGAAASVQPKYARKLCRVEPKPGQPFLAEGKSEKELIALWNKEYGATITDCGTGRQVQLRLGAFEFFRRMAEVESYTYAAFPRGDVSGVVIEASGAQSVLGGGRLPGLSGWASFGSDEARRTYHVEPEVINFASGQSRHSHAGADQPELFDFGWTVIRSGYKEAMMVSQLVLVSVPAYLDQIQLTLWKGFLDLDKVPADRDAVVYPLKNGTESEGIKTPAWSRDSGTQASLGASKEKARSFNQLDLAERIDVLMEGYERRTITLKVPPDLAALDNVAIGHNEILGPQINKKLLGRDESDDKYAGGDNQVDKGCLQPTLVEPGSEEANARPYYLLDVVIPGERLWRSTVVTLAGTKAHQIEVMPDMRGILAKFHLPGDLRLPKGPSERRKRLWVWTSEGNHWVDVELCPDRDYEEQGRDPQSESSGEPENELSSASAMFGDSPSTSGQK